MPPSAPPAPRAAAAAASARRQPASAPVTPHAAAAYAAFCRDHWPTYRQYAAAVTGDPATGDRLARAALRELGAQWPTALRSALPSALAWSLLRATTASSRTPTIRTLQRNLAPRETDALVLRYRLGLTPRQAGHAMGIEPSAVTLLTRNALRRATTLPREDLPHEDPPHEDLLHKGHMPMSDAL
ncbi:MULTISPECIES: hypothetical protein [unclassified Streptomyces]|uniref:hypothetical protein n=1 Tax=unclassified Streptomyces TaxID=2593676 RepID=UPI00382EFDC9